MRHTSGNSHSAPAPEMTAAHEVRKLLAEGWYVQQKRAGSHTREGVAQGLKRAFALPQSGSFDDLLRAIDEADAGAQLHPRRP